MTDHFRHCSDSGIDSMDTSDWGISKLLNFSIAQLLNHPFAQSSNDPTAKSPVLPSLTPQKCT